MRVPLTKSELLQWFGVFGGPLAWATQHMCGVFLTFADCGTVGAHGLPVAINTVTLALSVPLAVVALLALVASVVSFRRTRQAKATDAPPTGRQYFFAIIGMAVSPLFFAMIVMSSSGVVGLTECRQA